MEEIINKLSQAVKNSTPKRSWGIPIAILSAFVLIAVVVYYGDYFKDLFRGARAAAVQTWDLNIENDYSVSSGITFGSGFATVDLAFTPVDLSQFPNMPNITDLWYNGSNIMGAAIDEDGVVGYSVSDNPWGILDLTFAPGADPDGRGIRIKRIVDGGALNFIFGLGTTAKNGPDPGYAAVAYVETGLSQLNVLKYIYLPTATSFTAGALYKDRFYAGIVPKAPSTYNIVSVSSDLDLETTAFATVGTGVSSLNNFLVVNNRLYATATSTVSQPGEAVVWYTDDGTNWFQAKMWIGDLHTSTLSIVTDTDKYIYVTTDKAYLLKSTEPGGTTFGKITLPSGSAPSGLIYADNVTYGSYYTHTNNNIWIPLTDGGVLRSVDYKVGEGAKEFFRMKTGIGFTGGNLLKINDVLRISNGKVLWAGGVWQGTAFIKGAAWSSRTATDQYFINKQGVGFFDLQSFTTVVPLVVSNREFQYRISNKSETGPWYYYTNEIEGWEPSTDLKMANTDDMVSARIGQFTTEYPIDGTEKFYFQAIYTQSTVDSENYDVILDSISVGYEPLGKPPVLKVTGLPKFTKLATPFDFTITVEDYLGQPIPDFEEGLTIMGDDNLDFIPDGYLDISTCETTGWVHPSGTSSITYTGCTIFNVPANEGTHKIGGGYFDTLFNEIVFGYAVTVTGKPGLEITGVPQYIEKDKPFGFTVTAKDADGAVISFNTPDFVPNPPFLPRSNMIDDSSNDGAMTGCTASAWNNGVLIYSNCQINSADPINLRYVGAGYYDPFFDPDGIIYGSASTYVIDPEAEDVAYFRMMINVGSVPINTDFTIQLTAYVAQGFVKTNFSGIVNIIADGSDIGSLDDGVLQPTTITFALSDNGVATYSQYQISVADTYSLIASYDLAGNPVPITSQPITLRVTDVPVPTIVSVVPDKGIVGDTVTITVANMILTNPQVEFGGVAATVIAVSITKDDVIVTAPAHAPGLVEVRVKHAGYADAVRPDGFEYLAPLRPDIAGLDPTHGPPAGNGIPGTPPNTSVTITGSNFGSNQGTVKIGSVNNVTIDSWSDGIIKVKTPEGTPGSTVYVIVTTAGIAGQSSDPLDPDAKYTYDPDISSINPTHGYGGEEVIINGKGFGLAAGTVAFGSAPAYLKTGTNWSDILLTVIAPDGIPNSTAFVVVTTSDNHPSYATDVQAAYTYDVPGVSFLARYYSPMFNPVDIIQSLDSLTVVASGYGTNSANPGEITTIAIGFFDTNNALLGTGYYDFAAADQANFAQLLADLSGQAWLPDVAGIQFRIRMSDQDTTIGSGPWVQSITLTYSTVTTEIKTLTLQITNAANQQSSTGGNVTYNLTLSGNFVGYITLSTPVATDNDNPTYIKSALFNGANPATINKSTTDSITTSLIVSVQTWDDTNKPTLPKTIAFAITADAVGAVPALQSSASASLDIQDVAGNSITFHLTIPVEDVPSEAKPSIFTLNLYPDTPGITKGDYAASVNGTTTSQDTTNRVVIVDVPVLKINLTDGTTYVAYVRSTRHFWTKVSIVDGVTTPDGKVTVSFSKIAPYELGFSSPLKVGDLNGDNVINFIDIGLYMVTSFFKTPAEGADLIGDFDNNEMINFIDVSLYVMPNVYTRGDSFFD